MPGKFRKSQQAFTLMEMLVVIIIVGVLAGVALPTYSNHVERVRSSEGVQLLTAVLAAQERYRIENTVYTNNIANLDIDIPNSSNFTVPPTLYNTAARLAKITRSDGSYALCINSTGVVSCDGVANVCGGYAPGGTGVCLMTE